MSGAVPSSAVAGDRAAIRRRLPDVGPELMLVAGALAVLLYFRGAWISPLSDHGIWFSAVQTCSNGGRLYRDFGFPYTPLSLVLLTGVCSLFGLKVVSIAAFDFVVGLSVVLLLSRYSARFLDPIFRLFSSMALVALIVWLPGPASLLYPYAPAVGVGLAFLVLSMLSARRSKTYPLSAAAVSGVCAGLAILSKQEIGGVALAVVLLSIFAQWRRRSAIPIALACMVAFAVAAGGLAVAFGSIHILERGARFEVWPFARIPQAWRRQYTDVGGYGRPLRSAIWAVRAAAELSGLSAAAAAAWALLRGRNEILRRCALVIVPSALVGGALSAVTGGSLLSAVPLVDGAALLLAAVSLARSPDGAAAAVAPLAAAATLLSFRTGFLGWSDNPFAGVGFTLSIPVIAWLLARVWDTLFRPTPAVELRGFRRAALIGAGVVILTTVGAKNFLAIGGFPEKFVPLDFPRGRVWVPPNFVRPLKDVERMLSRETRPGDRIAFFPETHGLDFLLDRRSAVISPKLGSGLSLQGEIEIVRALSSNPPAAVVLFDETGQPFGTSGFGRTYGREIRRWIDDHERPAEVPARRAARVTILFPADLNSSSINIMRQCESSRGTS